MSEKEKIVSPALAPTLSAHQVDITPPGKEIEQTRKSTGCGVIAAICVTLAAGGSSSVLGYRYITKQFPFAPKESASVSAQAAPASASAEDADTFTPDTPVIINSNQDLQKALQIHKIQATARDFDFQTARPELQAKAIFLLPPAESDAGAVNQIKWRPVRERISRTSQKELLVAVKIINPNLGSDAYQLIIPEGLSYRARAVDAADPSIMYFYYDCHDKKGETALLAQIGIKDPVRPKKLMWARSFMLPTCQ